MKVTTRDIEFKSDFIMNVCFDVHKEELNSLARLPGNEFSDTCRNSTKQVERQLKVYHEIAVTRGKKTIRIICEPTGQYDRILLRTAHRMGFHTSYVNPENVAKYRQIETNDNGKTDTKDPKVISSLAEQEKLLRIRNLGEDYMTLRNLGSFVEDEEISIVRIKGLRHRQLVDIFCEYDFKKDFLYSNSGCALLEEYGCNPYKIAKDGFKHFEKKMKSSVKRIKNATIQRLWKSAEISILHDLPEIYIDCLEERMRTLYADCVNHIQIKEKIEGRMIDILNRLREDDPDIPPPSPGVISEKNMAKLLGETGCLSDFDSWRQLMRYGGLNLTERESGTYHGKTKVSKKGRRRLRKVLGNIILPLVRKKSLYGEFYHFKKDVDKMCGNKAMVVTARNFLRKFFGWYKAGGGEFKRERWFKCESQYKMLFAA